MSCKESKPVIQHCDVKSKFRIEFREVQKSEAITTVIFRCHYSVILSLTIVHQSSSARFLNNPILLLSFMSSPLTFA